MKILLKLAALFSLGLSAGAQQLYVYPAVTTPISVPRGAVQTFTAVVTGVDDKTVTWSTSGGTLLGTNPCVVNEPCTIGLTTTTLGTYTVTATTNTGAVTATRQATFTASPTVTTGHPRLLVTAAMLPSLQAKAANPSTLVYQETLGYTNTYYYTPDSSIWTFSTWSGSACTGGSGPSSDQTGNSRMVDANFFAWLSMVAPASGTRNQYGCAGRDVWIYVMNHIMDGSIDLAGNIWSDQADNLIWTGDWLMAGGYLSASDIILQRQFNAFMLKNVLTTNGGYGYTPPVTTYNNPAQWVNTCPSYQPCNLTNIRAMGNNYTYSRDMYLVGLSLMFDDNTTDDPPLANTCSATRYQLCADFTGGSEHAYFTYFNGSMLYLTAAHLEDPNVTLQAYNAAYANVPAVPTCQMTGGQAYPCFGDGRGGESSEGSWYQYSFYKLRYAMNMLYTTGYNDPTLYGPQMSLPTSSFWDMKAVSDLEFLTGYAQNNGIRVGPNQPSYSYLTTGDSNTYYRTPNDFLEEAANLTFDTYTGRTDRLPLFTWGMFNAPFGGPNGTSGTCSFYCGFDATTNIVGWSLHYDLLISLPAADPLASMPADPRPSLPTDLYNGSFNQHQMIRNGWTGANANSVVSFNCSNSLINHETMTCGTFSVYAGNEYVTKPRVVFNDYNTQMNVASQANELQIVPTTGSGANSAWQFAPQGGQWFQGQQNGLPALYHSELPAYAADIVDNTANYNGWYGFSTPFDTVLYNSVTSASRSLIYLRGTNQVVYMDRAAAIAPTSISTNLTTTGTPTLVGNKATWLTQSGTQKACYTGLMDGTLTAPGLIAGGVDQVWDWEPVSVINMGASSVSAGTFLSSLEWGASGFTCTTPSAVNSTAGDTFNGALLGGNLVMFMRTPGAFTGTTFPASSASMVYVADLVPNTSYPLSGAVSVGSAVSDSAGVLVLSDTGFGSITVGAGTPIAATPTFSPVAGTYVGTQNVTISTTTPSPTIYYTTDGSTPTTGSTVYSGPVAVSVSETLKALATASGFADSAVGSAAYVITVPTVPQSGASGTVTISGTVSLP